MISEYSGILVNQNQTPPTLFDNTGGSTYQTLVLPSDYKRGSITPELTGFQVFVNINASQHATATLVWRFEVKVANVWTTLDSGTAVGGPQDGNLWFNVLFSRPIDVAAYITSGFRIVFDQLLNGIEGLYYTAPNPLATGQLYHTATDAGVTDVATHSEVSAMFRILATTADEGTDFLGNFYRSAIIRSAAVHVDSFDIEDGDLFWMSQPNPSQFAVENLYFDQRIDNQPAVIDRVTIDPLTPGIYFHVYWSNDPAGPGTDAASWDNLLWTPVYKTFQAARRTTYGLPEPIAAKYLKVEFSRLQARSYDPGTFQVPTTYRKHPKWVLDYFLARFAAQEHDLLSSSVNVIYDALDLAFTYYEGDLNHAPDRPLLSEPLTTQQLQFFQAEDATTQVDSQTLSLIRIAFQPYTSQPALLGRVNSLLGAYAGSSASSNYSTEMITRALGATNVVSNLQREPLIVEKGFPIMFFYIPCRHGYRIAEAVYTRNIAYFAGVKQLIFHRDLYSGFDQDQYNEILDDAANVAINDFAYPPPILS